MNDELKSFLKKEDYYLFDLSTINNINNYKKYKFYKKECYAETIFYYNISLMPRDLAKYYSIKQFTNIKYIPNNYIFFYNNRYLICNKIIGNDYNCNNIISIKNILLSNDKYYTCNICFNKYENINTCIRCSFMYCKKCSIKLGPICASCKFDSSSSYRQ